MKLLQAGTSGGYEQVAKQLREARELFHEEIAHLVQLPLNEKLTEFPHSSREEKRKLVRYLNAEMRSLGIAIAVDGKPARIYVNSGGKYEPGGRFQMEISNSGQSERITSSSKDLPQFEFASRLERKEPLVDYWMTRAATRRTRGAERY